jgi:pyruvate/2-oxoglutarate dehydrogenase complex dihydrolipoamide acyltransferase (E2) component
MTEVPFPQMSKEKPDAEGVVSTWFVADGEHVDADQLLAEVQVDKVAAEVPAPVAGTVRLLVEEEGVVVQGTAIARIE